MYCRKCGKEIADDSKFCPRCGEQIEAESQERNSKNSDELTVSKVGNRTRFFLAAGAIVIIGIVIVSGVKEINDIRNAEENSNVEVNLILPSENTMGELSGTGQEEVAEETPDHVIIPSRSINGVNYAAYYDYDLTEEECECLDELIAKCEQQATIEEMDDFLFGNEMNEYYYLEKRLLSYGYNSANDGDDWYKYDRNDLLHIYYNNWKISFSYNNEPNSNDEKSSENCLLFLIPVGDGTGYMYSFDSYGDNVEKSMFTAECFTFRCIDGVIDGQANGVQKEKYFGSTWEKTITGTVENGLRVGKWERWEKSLSGTDETTYACCIYNSGKTDFRQMDREDGRDTFYYGTEYDADGKESGYYGSWSRLAYDEDFDSPVFTMNELMYGGLLTKIGEVDYRDGELWMIY